MFGFLTPWALLGLTLLPLYALWFRRPAAAEETPDATVFLWEAAAKQQPPRRLKIPWRLLLHLAILAALTVTAARPYAEAPTPPSVAVLLSLDLSMNASDGATTQAADTLGLTGPISRFAAAEAVALDLQSRRGPIRLYDAATLAPLSRDLASQADVRDTFARLRPTARRDTPPAPDPTQLAELTARTDAHWLADRPPPNGANVTVHNLAGRGRNVGVVATQGLERGVWFNLLSTHPTPQTVTVTAQPVTPGGLADLTAPALSSVRVTVPARGQASGQLTGVPDAPAAIVLTPPQGDALALDDVAFVDPRPVQVRLDRSSPRLERALNATGRADVRISQAAGRQPAELRILHGRSAEPGPGVVLRVPPPAADVTVGTGLPHLSRDPLVSGLLFSGVRLALSNPQDSPAPLEPSQTLVLAQRPDTPPQPLLTRTPRPQGDIIDLHAALGRGDLTNRAVFPAFIRRLVEEAEARRQQPLGTPAGDPLANLTPRIERAGQAAAVRHLVHPATSRLPSPDAFASASETAPQDTARTEQDLTPWPLTVALLLLMTEAALRLKDARPARHPSA